MTDDGRTGSEYAGERNHLMSRPSPTELELVRGLHARDPKTLARVYGDYHAAIYNLCARILGDREEAKDVTQDVFVKAFSKPPEAAEDVRLRPWLFRVATNACFNLIRARRTGDPVVTEEFAAPGDPYEQAQTAALIETCLAGMNERYRAALVLKDLHGLQGAELADVLEVSRPAADVLVHRARASFRRVFAGLAGGDVVAPTNLALALPMLPVPAALQALPLPVLHPPALDKTRLSIRDLSGSDSELAFWLSRSSTERLEAIEATRLAVYGYDPTSTRLRRLLEVARLPRS
jgi:RNA polymerase sigma-70 factor (ECF subfamily)